MVELRNPGQAREPALVELSPESSISPANAGAELLPPRQANRKTHKQDRGRHHDTVPDHVSNGPFRLERTVSFSEETSAAESGAGDRSAYLVRLSAVRVVSTTCMFP